jgi:hypothetical protein
VDNIKRYATQDLLPPTIDIQSIYRVPHSKLLYLNTSIANGIIDNLLKSPNLDKLSFELSQPDMLQVLDRYCHAEFVRLDEILQPNYRVSSSDDGCVTLSNTHTKYSRTYGSVNVPAEESHQMVLQIIADLPPSHQQAILLSQSVLTLYQPANAQQYINICEVRAIILIFCML